MNEEIFFIKLRDCFTAGYTMPQFCIDNEIKRPLFVAQNPQHWQFMWELYVQFKYDRRLESTFAIIEGKIEPINFCVRPILKDLQIKSADALNFEDYDVIIVLSTTLLNINFKKIIYLPQLFEYFKNFTYAEIPIRHLMQKHKNVKIFLVNVPSLHINKYSTDFEHKIRQKLIWDFREEIAENPNTHIETPFDFLGYNNQEVYDILTAADSKMNLDGSTTLQDNSNPLVGVKNGKRLTVGQPKNFKNTIYFLGTCVYFGIGAPPGKTIESYLQSMLNKNNLPYRVENESQFFSRRCQDIFYNLNNLPFKSGDIVFLCLHILSNNIPSINLSHLFDRPHNYGEVFADRGSHLNERGYKFLAENFFNLLVQNNFFQDIEFKYPAPPPPPHRYGIPQENFFAASNFIDNKDLEIYKQKLREKRLPIGATVMNCNPFTLGHKFLIEYAASKVHKLYIFVVEEDKSEFKFADRLKLVKAGVAEFPNVEVIPSGQFIISQKTFAGYFNKAELQNVQVDSSQDVEIFAREIAPTLGINIRFAGEEPEDTVTRQYNENLKNILPRYGIDFCEIPRKKIDGEIISAKLVREFLKAGNFEEIKKLVPETTLNFLIENYLPPPYFRLTKNKFIELLITFQIQILRRMWQAQRLNREKY